tara:strand:+ start:578 stop:691 length:114 start_codon:yes stop_codon:yes gene_type:complete
MNGAGNPVTGNKPEITLKFIIVCINKIEDKPTKTILA